MPVTPYLFLGGRTAEALDYYHTAIGAEIESVMTYDQSPDPCPEGMLPQGWGDKVMHSSLRVAGQSIFLGDGMEVGSNLSCFMLAVEVNREEEAHRLFNGLAEGGSVIMPLGPTFWSPLYGMLRDKFGVGWMIMLPGGK